MWNETEDFPWEAVGRGRTGRWIINKLFFFFKIVFIYLTQRDTAREGTQAGGVGEGEAGFPWSREPDARPDPRTLGS